MTNRQKCRPQSYFNILVVGQGKLLSRPVINRCFKVLQNISNEVAYSMNLIGCFEYLLHNLDWILFQDMMAKVIKDMPNDPISYLLRLLQKLQHRRNEVSSWDFIWQHVWVNLNNIWLFNIIIVFVKLSQKQHVFDVF